MWRDIQNIIGDAKEWPKRMRRLFWGLNTEEKKVPLTHFERLIVCSFVYVNGLNPIVFYDWCRLVNIVDKSGLHHIQYLLEKAFVEKRYTLYAYNVSTKRYEYLDGSPRIYV